MVRFNRYLACLGYVWAILSLTGCGQAVQGPGHIPSQTMNGAVLTGTPDLPQPVENLSTQFPKLTASDTATVESQDHSFETMMSVASQDDEVVLAKEDLAGRFKIKIEEISVVDQYADEFPASGLGCPSGKEYPRPIPAIITGKVIILGVNDVRYIYHASVSEIAYCGLAP